MGLVLRNRRDPRGGSEGASPSRWHDDDRPAFRWDLLFLALFILELIAIAILVGPWR